MKVVVSAVVLLLCSSIVSFGGTLAEKDAKEIHSGADRIAKSVLNGDPSVSVALMNPKILKEIGGKEKALEMATQANNRMKHQGIVVSEFETFETKEFFKATDEDVAFVKTRMVVDKIDARVTTESILIASKAKGDGRWFFTSGDFLRSTKEPLAELFPGLPKDVKVPEIKPQVVVNKEEKKEEKKHGAI